MDDALKATVYAVLDAVNGDGSRLPASADRLIRHAKGSGATLVRAGDVHTTADAAAVQAAWQRGDALRDDVWLLFRRNGTVAFEGPTTELAAAQWFLLHPDMGLPVFEQLPVTPEVADAAQHLLDMAQGTTPASSPEEEALTGGVDAEGLTATIGAVHALDAADRAMVELAWVEDEDPEWTEISRWAVLERRDDEWRVLRTVHLGSMSSLLEDAEPGWPAPTA